MRQKWCLYCCWWGNQDEVMSKWGWNDEEIFKGRNEDRIDGDLRRLATSFPGLGTPTLLCTSLPPPPAFQYFNSELYLYLYLSFYLYLPCSFVPPSAFPLIMFSFPILSYIHPQALQFFIYLISNNIVTVRVYLDLLLFWLIVIVIVPK